MLRDEPVKRERGDLGAVPPEKFLRPRPLLWLRLHLAILEQVEYALFLKDSVIRYALFFRGSVNVYVLFTTYIQVGSFIKYNCTV